MSKHRLSHLRVGRRLGLAFGAVGALVLVSTAWGCPPWPSSATSPTTSAPPTASCRRRRRARFQIADVSGWQGLVMADVAAFGPAVGARPGRLQPAPACWRARTPSTPGWTAWTPRRWTPTRRRLGPSCEPAWDNYFAMDDQVVAWVSDGSAEGFRTAVESINGGEAGEGYGIILDIADRWRPRPRTVRSGCAATRPRPRSGPPCCSSASASSPSSCPAGPRDARRPLGRPAAAPGEGRPWTPPAAVTSPWTPA